MSSRDLEPQPVSAPVGRVGSVLGVLIIIGIACGAVWLLAGLVSSYVWLFS
ncbi:hypothetical protein [Streptomyces palmae]|uniref:hypothetical protein n=1 Tax=Streptomyces palmae TaxID=1701085 RepID=UPI00143284B8|nr:hypothetical protein [Streptomyces palmae]